MSSGFVWPVPGRISSAFGKRAAPKAGASTNHSGVDIPTPIGTAVKSALSGVVSAVDSDRSMGRYVTVDHGNGLVSRYQHLDGSLVKKGDTVTMGQVIAKSGNTGTSTGPHLHFSLMQDGKYLNPETFNYSGSTANAIDSAMGNLSEIVSGSGIMELLEKYWYLIVGGLIVVGLLGKIGK